MDRARLISMAKRLQTSSDAFPEEVFAAEVDYFCHHVLRMLLDTDEFAEHDAKRNHKAGQYKPTNPTGLTNY